MSLAFRLAVESDFTTAANVWQVAIPIAAQPGDYLITMLASPTAGVIWSASGWEQLDAFSTVNFTLGGFAQSPQQIPISYAIFGKFMTPQDLNPSGTQTASFWVGTAPTQVIGAVPGSAAGVALMASYIGVSKAQPIRGRGLSQIPPISISYQGATLQPITVVTLPAFTPVTSAAVPAIFANVNDWIVSPLILPGSGVALALPGASFIYRAATTGGIGVVIVLVDENVNQGGMQSGLAWAATSMPTPLITEAIALWPDNSYLNQEISLYAALDKNPVHLDYLYSQGPEIIANSAGYLFKVYPGPQAYSQALFAANLLTAANLLFTRSDGSTFTIALTLAPDGSYAFGATNNAAFPYTGQYYCQLQLLWGTGAVQFSSQTYLQVSPQGGQ